MARLSSTQIFGNLYVDNQIYSLGEIEGSNIKVGGQSVYHPGNKPTLSDLGAAATSHTHNNYLEKTGGDVNGVITLKDNATPLRLIRDNSPNLNIEFKNNTAGNIGTKFLGTYAGTELRFGDNADLSSAHKIYHQGFKPTASELDVFTKAESDSKYVIKSATSSKTLAAGWYIIAKNIGNRATAKFSIRETMSSQHGSAHFYATSSFGRNNNIHVLASSSYANNGAFRHIRIWGGDVYEGCYLEVYVDTSATNGCYAEITENIQVDGWEIVDWQPHTDNLPGTGNPVGSEKTKVDLDLTGGIISNQEMYVNNNKVYHAGNKPSAADIGLANLTPGSYITGSPYNGTAAQTFSIDGSTTSTGNKVAIRDTSGDLTARLFRSEYGNQNTISGAMAFRISNSGDNYMRFCSDTSAIRTFLDTYSKSEADSKFRQKTDMTFGGVIEIVTPAS